MLLTEADVLSLVKQRPITGEWPWNTNDESTIHKNIVAEIRRKNRLLDKTEFDHYGSGYASFVDCWLYREDEEFRFQTGNCFWGLVVLFSTLSPYYVIGEGQKIWQETSASSYLPSFSFVDQLEQPATKSIADDVCNILDNRGLVRVYTQDLSQKVPHGISIPTILGDPPFHHFDALFYWED